MPMDDDGGGGGSDDNASASVNSRYKGKTADNSNAGARTSVKRKSCILQHLRCCSF